MLDSKQIEAVAKLWPRIYVANSGSPLGGWILEKWGQHKIKGFLGAFLFLIFGVKKDK